MRHVFHIALLGLAGVLAGCRSVRSDLSAPYSRTELPAPPVVVATGADVLPIVTDDRLENRQASVFLADAIEATCGLRPRVAVLFKGQACVFTNALFVGGEDRTAGEEGFRVLAKDGSVRFLGRADYAVFDWCERALGMRYYCAEGKCVERRPEIVVPAVDYADRPVFEHRATGGNAVWMRFSKIGSVHRGGVNVHAPHGWYRDEKLKAAEPEIFETGKSPMLCYGNPATLAYYKRRIDRHIAGLEDSGGIVDTKRKVITVCQWDAPLRCDCRWCRTQYAYAGADDGFGSPVIWGRFLAKLSAWAKTAHPDYLVSFLPYLNTCGVPSLDLPDNCEAEVCTMPGLALLKDGSCKRREEGILRGWQAATGRKVLDWHYGCWPQDYTSAPYVFGKTVQRHYADMADVSCGTYVCGGFNDPRLAISMYVWLKCLWNPDVDVEAVYDGFARRMFGAAERPMRELIALQETCWNRTWESPVCTYRHVFETSFPREDVLRMKALLREASERVRAAGDETAARRVAWYASGFRRFFAESDALGEHGAERPRLPRVVRTGETNAFVRAREVWHPAPWAKTTAVARREGESLAIDVRCEEPAARTLDFTSIDDDFVWGDDSVTFAFDDAGRVRKGKVYRNGLVRGGADWLTAHVTHDATGWTVSAKVRLSPETRAAGRVRGNVSRWRVGDRRQEKASRVPGSQYEHSRLGTCFTQPDDDPAAFVEFRFDGAAR